MLPHRLVFLEASSGPGVPSAEAGFLSVRPGVVGQLKFECTQGICQDESVVESQRSALVSVCSSAEVTYAGVKVVPRSASVSPRLDPVVYSEVKKRQDRPPRCY
uniref:Uncharacterized protein n=1 Tax=Knipowitschia caucasica TaxID=637954 RepID=A0AAV2JG14_KNICA